MARENSEIIGSGSTKRVGRFALCIAVSALALTACSKKEETTADTGGAPAATTTTTVVSAALVPEAAAPAAARAAAAPAAPAADNTDTITGVKLASYTGDAAKGKVDFITCQTCHSLDAGVNKIGPSLHGIIGRKAGTVPDFKYSNANKGSGITWTPEKLFQYLEKPQRVVPGTKMTFAGFDDPQKRADVIAYLQAHS
ncbi:cytochrome c family protein [Polymorphobacter arshaanensis]|uniref:Cytochrome c family protein n=1 Tax=Glacieibacterium arshaanense TaxID=2511025 RepID=A0A4Y9EM63_9SPHN|nr:cytochrome c family protein [Polymorphobacter arshaanensis]TFU03092.1 cytochrome c family protein [Polymorphobacter arshaanensis]